MGRVERIAGWIGAILTAVSICLMSYPPALRSSRRQNARGREQASTEALAEKLKQAWGDRHTP